MIPRSGLERIESLTAHRTAIVADAALTWTRMVAQGWPKDEATTLTAVWIESQGRQAADEFREWAEGEAA